MATLGRSMSLQVNTGSSMNSGASSQPQSTQAGSLFSSTSQPGGLFGSLSQQPTQTGSLFGGAQGTSKPTLSLSSATSGSQPSTGGLFGTANTSAPQAGGLFGASASSSTPQLGGLFGSATASTKPAGATLFGTSNTASSSGLFGSVTTPAQQPSGSLFGLNTKNTATTTPSLFPTMPTTNQQAGGLFGSVAQSQQQQQTKPSAPLFSLGTSQPTGQQQQQIVPGVKIDWSNIKPTTRFEDLHEDVQKQICAIDDYIQSQIQLGKQISAALPAQGQLVESLPADVKYLEDREEIVELAVESDAREVKAAKDLTRRDADDAKISFAAIENLKLPIQFHYQPGVWPGSSTNVTGAPAPIGLNFIDDSENGASAGDLIAYFQSKVDEIKTRVDGYAKQVQEIEEHMAMVEYSTVEQMQRLARNAARPDAAPESAKREQMADLAAALRGVEDAIIRVASNVGRVHEDVVALQFPNGKAT